MTKLTLHDFVKWYQINCQLVVSNPGFRSRIVKLLQREQTAKRKEAPTVTRA